MTLTIVANGVIEDDEVIEKEGIIIAVDGGLRFLDKRQIKPDLIVGDMDSVESGLLEKYESVPQRNFLRDKDKSDLELAIEIAFSEFHAVNVVIRGGFGGRIDHSLYNIGLLRRYPGKVSLESSMEKAVVLSPGESLYDVELGTTVSLIPLSDRVSSVTTEGLKWELEGSVLTKEFMSLSNVVVSQPCLVKFTLGELLFFIYCQAKST